MGYGRKARLRGQGASVARPQQQQRCIQI